MNWPNIDAFINMIQQHLNETMVGKWYSFRDRFEKNPMTRVSKIALFLNTQHIHSYDLSIKICLYFDMVANPGYYLTSDIMLNSYEIGAMRTEDLKVRFIFDHIQNHIARILQEMPETEAMKIIYG